MTLDPPNSRRLPLDTDRKMYRVGYHGDSIDVCEVIESK
jgi:hypothetical protein